MRNTFEERRILPDRIDFGLMVQLILRLTFSHILGI